MSVYPFPLPPFARTADGVNPGVWDALLDTAEGYKNWPVFMHGEQGSGKTCAALALGDVYGRMAYCKFPRFCSWLLSAMNGEIRSSGGYPITAGEIWEAWSRANLCIIDEIGTRERATDFQYETLLRLVDDRLENEGPFIAISNYGADGIAKMFDNRIASRLMSGTVIKTVGDRRLNH